METSLEQILQFKTAAELWLETNKSETKAALDLLDALYDVLGQVEPIEKEYLKNLARLKRKYAMEGAGGRLLYEPNGNYAYTKESEAQMDAEYQDMREQVKQFNIEPLTIPAFPIGVHRGFLKRFNGFVTAEKNEQPAN